MKVLKNTARRNFAVDTQYYAERELDAMVDTVLTFYRALEIIDTAPAKDIKNIVHHLECDGFVHLDRRTTRKWLVQVVTKFWREYAPEITEAFNDAGYYN